MTLNDKPTINNIIIQEVDDVDVPTDKTDESRNEIRNTNIKFVTEQMVPELLKKSIVCPCCMPEFIQKNERRRKILNIPPQQFNPGMDQEDIDNNKFSVVVRSHDERYLGVIAVVRECTKCHSLAFWGDSEIMSHFIAKITANKMNNDQYITSQETPTEMSMDNLMFEEVQPHHTMNDSDNC